MLSSRFPPWARALAAAVAAPALVALTYAGFLIVDDLRHPDDPWSGLEGLVGTLVVTGVIPVLMGVVFVWFQRSLLAAVLCGGALAGVSLVSAAIFAARGPHDDFLLLRQVALVDVVIVLVVGGVLVLGSRLWQHSST